MPTATLQRRLAGLLTAVSLTLALDVTAALNHVRFVAAGDRQVTLEAAPTDRKDAATPPK